MTHMPVHIHINVVSTVRETREYGYHFKEAETALAIWTLVLHNNNVTLSKSELIEDHKGASKVQLYMRMFQFTVEIFYDSFIEANSLSRQLALPDVSAINMFLNR